MALFSLSSLTDLWNEVLWASEFCKLSFFQGESRRLPALERGCGAGGPQPSRVCVPFKIPPPPPPFNAQEKNEIRLLNVMNKKKILLLPCFIGVNN